MAAQPSQPPLKPPSKVSTQAIQKAVKALLKWHSANPKPQNSSPSSEFLYLVTTLNQIPQNFRPQNPYKIPLPNPLTSPHSPTFTICLIVEDRFAKSSKQKIEAESLPVSNVIKLSKLKSDYKSFEKKKELCESYDAFFADKSVVPDLPKVLGRYFYKRKKVPVGVELGRSDWLEQIEEACGSASLSLKTGGTCSVVRVASLAMRKQEIVANVVAAVDGVANVVPKKWRNVKLFHLKLAESLALPIYEAGGGGLESVEVGSGGIVGEKRRKEMDLAKARSKKGKVLV